MSHTCQSWSHRMVGLMSTLRPNVHLWRHSPVGSVRADALEEEEVRGGEEGVGGEASFALSSEEEVMEARAFTLAQSSSLNTASPSLPSLPTLAAALVVLAVLAVVVFVALMLPPTLATTASSFTSLSSSAVNGSTASALKSTSKSSDANELSGLGSGSGKVSPFRASKVAKSSPLTPPTLPPPLPTSHALPNTPTWLLLLPCSPRKGQSASFTSAKNSAETSNVAPYKPILASRANTIAPPPPAPPLPPTSPVRGSSVSACTSVS
mmetsp:Transcript_14718/g.29445  ORF Transcript_14718/g.29445 Transcript_14718/m.29445 type:complete len:266 (-) Transcript_14718:844-1641(-)